jgi:hypothetical protein
MISASILCLVRRCPCASAHACTHLAWMRFVVWGGVQPNTDPFVGGCRAPIGSICVSPEYFRLHALLS